MLNILNKLCCMCCPLVKNIRKITAVDEKKNLKLKYNNKALL